MKRSGVCGTSVVLGVDAYRAAGRRLGVGRHVQYLLQAWAHQDLPFERVRIFSPEPLRDIPSNERFRVEVLPTRGPGIWWQNARLRPRLRGVDLLFAPYVLPPWYQGRSVVLNCAIYEGQYAETFPDWRSRLRSRHLAHSSRRADRVVATCESTKADLSQWYGVPSERISVVLPGVEERFHPAEDGDEGPIGHAVEQVLGDQRPYFLFVGKLSLRRNMPALLEAFAEVAAKRPDLRLLVVGQNTSGIDLAGQIARLGLNGAVRHIEHLDHQTLALLYRGALAFVLPTEHEGFSATTMEALASGTAVLVREHRTLLEEGLAEAVLAVPDAEPDTLSAALERLADDEDLRIDLGHRGVRAVASLSWDECARRTMDMLERAASAA